MQNLYRDSLGRFRSPPHQRIRTVPREVSLCGKDCSIFAYCKRTQDKMGNIGKPCSAKARLPARKSVPPIYDIRRMARQEHEIRKCACEGWE